ncbi:MAG: EVE domain-containing protein [Rudaea sp.]
MNYWLMKSEPEDFSIDDLAKRRSEPWNGVRNYQARNFIRDGMKMGDMVFFYHSNCEQPGIVGLAEISRAAYPDPTQFDPKSQYYDAGSSRDAPRWLLVDVKFKRKLKREIPLLELKAAKELQDLALVRRGNRLSVMPVSKAEWDFILTLERKS